MDLILRPLKIEHFLNTSKSISTPRWDWNLEASFSISLMSRPLILSNWLTNWFISSLDNSILYCVLKTFQILNNSSSLHLERNSSTNKIGVSKDDALNLNISNYNKKRGYEVFKFFREKLRQKYIWI